MGEFNARPLNREVELLLQGEDPYTALAAAEAADLERNEDVKEEGGMKRDYFDPAPTFQGARPGWCFKMGARGLGYYRDPKQDVKDEDKRKVKEEEEEKDKEKTHDREKAK